MKFKRKAEVILTMNRQANKNDLMPLLKRVLGIMLREYKAQFCLVVALILGAALATLRGTLFMRDLVDEYIKPMIGAETPDFGPLAHALLSLALAGGIVPAVLLPGPVRQLSELSPVTWLLRLAAWPMGYGLPLTAWLCPALSTAGMAALALVLYRRRVDCQEVAV